MPQTLATAFGVPAVLDQTDSGTIYVYGARWTANTPGWWLGNTWWGPTTNPGMQCQVTAHQVTGSVNLTSNNTTWLAGSNDHLFTTPQLVASATQYVAGIRANRYAFRNAGSVPASAFPYSNAPLNLSALGGCFVAAPAGVIYPSTDAPATLFYVGPIFEPIVSGRASIFLGSHRRVRRGANRRAVIITGSAVGPLQQRTVRWRFDDFGPKWRFNMLTERVSILNSSRVQVTVTADADGLPYDPTGAAVRFAFLTDRLARPEPGDWVAGSWDVTRIGSFVAQCNVGDEGVTALDQGYYYVWIELNDPAAVERPTVQLAKLLVQ